MFEIDVVKEVASKQTNEMSLGIWNEMSKNLLYVFLLSYVYYVFSYAKTVSHLLTN